MEFNDYRYRRGYRDYDYGCGYDWDFFPGGCHRRRHRRYYWD